MYASNLSSPKDLSKNSVKFIKSLQIKKYRLERKSFLIEGAKNVRVLLASDYEVKIVVGTPAFIEAHRALLVSNTIEIFQAHQKLLASLGTFQTNNAALAVASFKKNKPLTVAKHEYGLVLDAIRDPGNLGTILRIADWYGILKIICSEDTVDVYNPKVLHASMGTFTRVRLYYTDLAHYLSNATVPIIGAFMEGENIHRTKFPLEGLIAIGNESQGISPTITPYIAKKVCIPLYGHVASLNAAVATAVICDNWRRQTSI